MTRKLVFPFLVAVACFGSLTVCAQDKAALDRMYSAHAQYYTPTTRGLDSFHCNASINWQAMLSRFTHTEIPDDNPFLKYLKTVRLSVSDDLNGEGKLKWEDTAAPPDGKEPAAKQTQEGLKTTVGGFFKTLNAYMNGSMVPLVDGSFTVTTAGEGVHLNAKVGPMTLDEDFDKNMLLTQALVVNPDMRVLAKPVFVKTDDGLLVSSVRSEINQPPTAPLTVLTIKVDYATVDSLRLPSHVVFDIQNLGVIEMEFTGCQATLAKSADKK